MKTIKLLRKHTYLFRIFVLLLFPASSFAALDIDSLAAIYRNPDKPDSSRQQAFNNLVVTKIFTDPAGTIEYINEFIGMARMKNNKKWEADAYWKRGIAYREMGDYPASTQDLLQSRALYEQLNDPEELAKVYNSLGGLYAYQQQFETAKEYFQKSLEIAKESGVPANHADALLNMAAIHEMMDDLEATFSYNYAALAIYDSLGNEEGQAYIYANMATIYSRPEINKTDSALQMYFNASEILKKGTDKKGQANVIFSIGSTYLQIGNIGLAKKYCAEAKDISKESGLLKINASACKCLFRIYEKEKNYKSALDYYKEYIQLRDSLSNDDDLREMTKREMQFAFDKTKYADSLKKAEEDRLVRIRHEEDIQRQTIYTYTGAAGFILMLGFAFVLLRGYRIKQRSNNILQQKNSIITQQKLIVDEKNKEIVDSIQYAKRLQDAILPPMNHFENNLPQSFVLYKPKDIVAGDFYWLEKNEFVFLAAADCTGHGVPGAMVSVVCSNALNRSVKEFGLKDPGKILDKVTELVEETFSKSESEVKDGMDISLCALDTENNRLLWAGANNPLWIIDANRNLQEIKADKQPVGFFANRKSFTTHNLQLNKGDTLYLFTDGLPDQFGGDSGKKFKYSKFKELILSIQDYPMHEQKNLISSAFETWKGNLEQVDDVCIIGVKI